MASSAESYQSTLLRARAAPAAGARPRRPTVAVFGEWNTANLGDVAIHREVCRFFAECGWRPVPYGFGSLAPVTDPVEPRTCAARRRAALGSHAKRMLRGVLQRYRMVRLLPRLRHAHAIAVGGGALLSDVNLHFPQSLAALTDAALLLDKPLLCLGCSADDGWSAAGEDRVRAFLAACSVIAARDEDTSVRIAAAIARPVMVFGDFCFTEARAADRRRWTHSRHDLAVNVFQIPPPWHAAQARYEDALIALIGRLARNTPHAGPRTIRIFTTGTVEDVVPAWRVYERLAMRNVELVYPRSLDQLLGVLRQSALVIASRLHAAVLALAECAPVYGIAATPKLDRYFSTMRIGAYSVALQDCARVAHWLGSAGYEALLDRQRAALEKSPAWNGRAATRNALESLARACAEPYRAAARCT